MRLGESANRQNLCFVLRKEIILVCTVCVASWASPCHTYTVHSAVACQQTCSNPNHKLKVTSATWPIWEANKRLFGVIKITVLLLFQAPCQRHLVALVNLSGSAAGLPQQGCSLPRLLVSWQVSFEERVDLLVLYLKTIVRMYAGPQQMPHVVMLCSC